MKPLAIPVAKGFAQYVVSGYVLALCRYSMMSLTATTGRAWRSAKLTISGSLAMLPSLFVSSHNTPLGGSPASFIISTVDSVWPGRSRMPFFFATRSLSDKLFVQVSEKANRVERKTEM
jgi:hypothetical protein